jgi:hypothetical protein
VNEDESPIGATTGNGPVRTVDGMGTTIYGSYDRLVIELSGLDVVRAGGRRAIRIPLDEIVAVTDIDAGTAHAFDVHDRFGSRRHPAVLITCAAAGSGARRFVVVHRRDAAEAAADLVHRGVGRAQALVAV